MFTDDLEEVVHKACLKAIKYESKLLEWVFEKGELQKMSRENLEDYMKFRVNESLDQLGFKKRCVAQNFEASPRTIFKDMIFGNFGIAGFDFIHQSFYVLAVTFF